jgi:hypothetical protein
MAIDFRRGSITFDPTKGLIQDEVTSVVFNSSVRRADVALNGFDIRYTDEDREVFREMIDASIAEIRDRTVDVRVRYLLRDASGSIDDRFQGRVDVLVIAEVA